MTTPPKPLKKSKKNSSMSMSFGSPEQKIDLSGAQQFYEQEAAHSMVVDHLKKSLNVQPPNSGKAKTVFVSKTTTSSSAGNIEQKGNRRLTDQELRDLSILDPYISSIISTRVAQSIPMGRPSESKFDKGLRIIEINPLKVQDFQNPEQFKHQSAIRKKQTSMLLEWALHCGTQDEDQLDEIYRDADKTFKHCKLHSFIACQVRNLLTFGRCATHVIKDAAGNPILFRPVPVESIYKIKDGEAVNLSITQSVTQASLNDAAAYNSIPQRDKPAAYVQRLENRDEAFFTDDEMLIWNYQDQALTDLNGYNLAPTELAMFMVFVHQQTLQYLRNTFVKGMAAKGMIVLESTSESSTLSSEDLEDFRQQFHNFVSRNDNSAAIPVIGGSIKAQFIPLNATPKDMEFLATEDHIVRAICSAFQIAPTELLQATIGEGSGGSLSKSGKETELISSQERGLRILLDVIFDGLNDIVGTNFPELKTLYRLEYTGVGTDTKESIIQQNISELQTTATMSSLWASSERTDPFPFAGDAPLAQAFWAGPGRFMFFGEIREHFFGDKEASKKPEYQFLTDPNLNQAYQQLKITPVEQQAQAAQVQNQMGHLQLQQAEAQTQQPPQEEQGQPSGPAQEEQGQPQEQQQKSLKDQYREKMQKSVKSYFQEWMSLHEK